jgi:hypothetical protein
MLPTRSRTPDRPLDGATSNRQQRRRGPTWAQPKHDDASRRTRDRHAYGPAARARHRWPPDRALLALTGHRCASRARMGDEAQLIPEPPDSHLRAFTPAMHVARATEPLRWGDISLGSKMSPARLRSWCPRFESGSRRSEAPCNELVSAQIDTPRQRAQLAALTRLRDHTASTADKPPPRAATSTADPPASSAPASCKLAPSQSAPITPVATFTSPPNARLSGARNQSGGVARSLGSPSCDGPARTRESTGNGSEARPATGTPLLR